MSRTYEQKNAANEQEVGGIPYYPAATAFDLGPRLRRAFRQFIKYSAVGASGFVLNLIVYSALIKGAGTHYMLAASISFSVAVTNNFVLNKYWTFGNPGGALTTQARRFLIVSVVSLMVNLAILRLLMEFIIAIDLPGIHVNREIVAQTLAISICTVLNFTGNKLWSFRHTTAG